MPFSVLRERLLAVLAERHRTRVIALEAPPGFGKSVLLDQAVCAGPLDPGDVDLVYRCGPGDDAPGALALGLLKLCDAAGRFAPGDPGVGVSELAAALASRTKQLAAELCLVVDGVDRVGESGEALLRDLLDCIPDGMHVVLSGRRLPPVGLAKLVASGDASLIGAAELSFDGDELTQLEKESEKRELTDRELGSWPALASLMLRGHSDLVLDYVRETALPDLEASVARGLAIVSSVGGVPNALIEAVLSVEPDHERDAMVSSGVVASELSKLPLAGADDGCWPHPVWVAATAGILSPAECSRATLAKVKGLIASASTHDAGRQAIESKSASGLATVVRAALSTQPPRASVADLRSWASAGVLRADSIERRWLEAVIDLQAGDRGGAALRRLESVRHEFEVAGDYESELSVMFHLGILARSNSDVAALDSLLARGEVLAETGSGVARVLLALGEAVAAQMRGRPSEAIAALDRIPAGSLNGEWASQALMMRGTNLLLGGRNEEAIEALHSSTGEGSPYTRSIAHALLSTAKWYSGDSLGAIEEAELAERLARNSTTSWVVRQRTAWRACVVAATGQSDRAAEMVDQMRFAGNESADEETNALIQITEALIFCSKGEIDRASELLAGTEVAPRATRAAVWKASLGTALSVSGEFPQRVSADATLRRAFAAGAVGAGHLAGGPPAGGVHRPFLLASWCEKDPSATMVRVVNSAEITRNGDVVDHRSWARTRVRELFLHLALAENATRGIVAAHLWPDLLDRDAGRNLRVTLTHLLDVLDPDRPKGTGSGFIVDTEGRLSLNRSSGIRVDIWEHDRYAKELMDTPEHERTTLLAHARRLVGADWGPFLGGVPLGEWAESHRRRREDLRIRALLRGAAVAISTAEYRLAEELAIAAIGVDPWSERAHSLLIEARIDVGDIDAARRAFTQAMAIFRELGVVPRFSVGSISKRLGLRVSV